MHVMPTTSELEKIAAPPRLEPPVDAWEAVVAASAILRERIEEALSAEGLPSLNWFDVLGTLSESPEGRLRPRELVCAVSVTKSGLTRLLDRIEAAGLIERLSCPTDRRGHLVVLTDDGAATAVRMKPIRDRVVENHFTSLVSDQEATTIIAALHRVRESAAGPVCTRAEEAAEAEACDEAEEAARAEPSADAVEAGG